MNWTIRPLARRAAAVLAAASVFAAPRLAHAQAVTLTFADRACAGSGTNTTSAGLPYDVSGYRFTAAPVSIFSTPCSGNSTYAGTTTLYADNVGSVTTLARTAGGPFSITSIDLAPLLNFTGQSQIVTFTGSLVGGGSVSQSFTIPVPSASVPPVLATYTFLPTFTNLNSLQLSANVQPYYQFTNVRLVGAAVSAVPEPGTWMLLGSGLALLGVTARRRRR